MAAGEAEMMLAIDQGTTNTKAVVVTAKGRVRGAGSAPVAVRNPTPGQVEQDPDQIWRSVVAAVGRALAAASSPRLAGIALSTQRESVLCWRRSAGEPVGPLLGWQDRRTAGWCADLAGRPGAQQLVEDRTGLRVDPMFSAPKLRWLLDQAGDVHAEDLCAGTVDAWLVWSLTGGAVHACDAGNASRTLLYDVTELSWSEELCELFGVPASTLPEVRRSDAGYGTTRGLTGVPDGTPVVAAMADSHAALFGQGGSAPGLVKATYGTGSSVMMSVDGYHRGVANVPITLAWLTATPAYAREGNILSSGATLAWTAELLGLASAAELVALAATVPDTGGVQLLPAFNGLGAPHWDRDVRASLSGLTQATTPAHVARAAVDAVAHQVCDVVEAITAGGERLDLLRADGGATASDLLMQTQADLLDTTVEVADVAEVSALGAARMGWSALGASSTWRQAPPARTFVGSLSPGDRAARRTSWRLRLDTERAAATRRS